MQQFNINQPSPQPDLTLPAIAAAGRIINPGGVGGPLDLRTLSDNQIMQVYNRAYGIVHHILCMPRVSAREMDVYSIAFRVKNECAAELWSRFAFKKTIVRSMTDELI